MFNILFSVVFLHADTPQLLVLYGLFVALSARDIHGFYSEDKVISFVIYNLTFSCVIGIPVYLSLADSQFTVRVSSVDIELGNCFYNIYFIGGVIYRYSYTISL